MLQTGKNTKLIKHHQHGFRPFNARDAKFRREIHAKAIAEQGKALGSALLAAGRLVGRVIWVVVDFWNIPVFGAGDSQRDYWAPRDRLYDRF